MLHFTSSVKLFLVNKNWMQLFGEACKTWMWKIILNLSILYKMSLHFLSNAIWKKLYAPLFSSLNSLPTIFWHNQAWLFFLAPALIDA